MGLKYSIGSRVNVACGVPVLRVRSQNLERVELAV